MCVYAAEQKTWREGIFGLHAVLHKFVIACWVLWSTLTMKITNDPGRGCVCMCVFYFCVFLSELHVMKLE